MKKGMKESYVVRAQPSSDDRIIALCNRSARNGQSRIAIGVATAATELDAAFTAALQPINCS